MITSGRKFSSKRFQDELRDLVPATSSAFDRDLLWHLLYSTWRDGTGTVVSQRVLATCANELDQLSSRNFSGEKHLRQFNERIGLDNGLFDSFSINAHERYLGLARTISFTLAEPLQQLVFDEDRSWRDAGAMEDLIACDTGKKYSWRFADAERSSLQATIDEVITADTVCPVSAGFLQHLNSLPPNRFTSLVSKNLDAALAKAWELPEPEQRLSAMNTLRAIQEQPKPLYKPSLQSRTYRVFPANASIPGLPSDIRRALTDGCYECDLQNSQLAIVGWRWGIPALVEFASSGISIWDELASFLGLPLTPDLKRILKHEFLYPVVYGRTPQYARYVINKLTSWSADIGGRVCHHPLIAKTLEARERMIWQLRKDGSYTTYLGRHFELEGAAPDLIDSVLAHDAQDIELAVMVPIIQLDREEKYFDIILHQHDGMTLRLHHPQRIELHQRKISEAVERRAREIGFSARLTWKECAVKPSGRGEASPKAPRGLQRASSSSDLFQKLKRQSARHRRRVSQIQ